MASFCTTSNVGVSHPTFPIPGPTLNGKTPGTVGGPPLDECLPSDTSTGGGTMPGGGSCGCECGGGCGGGCGGSCGGGCGGSGGGGGGGAGQPVPRGPVINTFWAGPAAHSADRALHKVNHAIRHGAAVSLVGGCSTATKGTASYWDPNSGNLLKQVKLPATGPMSPVIRFTYNNQGTSVASIGGGFSMNYVRRVSEINSTTADVLDGMGNTLRYTNKNAVTGQYDPPAGARNGLVKNASGTWTETQPDETRLQYLSGTNGRLKAIEAKTGTWTILFNASNQVRTILDPANQRTTLVYGAGMPNLLSYVQDPAGRRTTLTRDIVHHVTKFQTPLGSVSLTYVSPFDGNSPLKAWASPDGTRATFLFDSSSPKRLRAMFAAGTTGYTMTYSGSTTRALKDPRGYVSTMLFNADGQVRATVSPTNDRTTISWSSGFPTVLQNPLGHRTTLAYATATSGVKRLKMIQTPVAGRFTWVYDASDRVKATIDQMGRRATLLYDAGGNRSAEINALGNRLTILWQSGQVKAVVNPLGFRWTSIYDASGRNTAYVNPLGNRWTFGYTSNSIQTTVKTPLGYVWTTLFDSMNRPRAWINPLGFRTTATYDASGNLRALKNPLGITTTTLFDTSSRKRAFIDPLGNRTTYGFDSAGNRVSVKNPLGHVTTTVFDSENQAKAIVDALGYRTTFGFDAAGNQVTMKNALGYVTSFLFDADDRQRATINALGYRTTFGSNSVGQVISIKNALGKVTTSVFDAAGQLTAVINPLGNRTSFGFDSVGQQLTVKNPLGKVSTTLFDGAGQPRASIDALGNRTTIGFDAAGRQITTKNPLGKVTSTVFDAADRQVARVNPLGNRWTTGYDAASRRVTSKNPIGKIVTTLYDAVNQHRATITSMGFRTSYAFDAAGQRKRATNALGRITTTLFDAIGRTRTTIDALGNRTTLGLDALGQRIRLTNALGNVTTTLFDVVGQIRASINSLGQRTTLGFDAVGRRVRETNSLGQTYTTTFDDSNRSRAVVDPLENRTTYHYDVANHRTSVVDANGNRTSAVFDAADRLIATVTATGHRTTKVYDAATRQVALIDGRGNRCTFQYDDAGNMRLQVDPLGRRTTFASNVNGSNELRIDARGYRTTYTFDDDDRLTGWRYPDGSRVTFAWDALGNRILAQDLVGRYTTSFDDLGRKRAVTNPAAKTITYTYDAISQRRFILDPDGGRFTYLHDQAGRHRALINPQAERTSWTFDAAGSVTLQRLSHGARASYTYDEAGRTATLYHFKDDGTPISSFEYVYDAAGIPLHVAESNGDRVTWSFDPTYQLTRDRRSGAHSYDMTYIYDAAGNRRVRVAGPVRTTHAYDAANQLIWYLESADRTTLVYDNTGNLQVEIVPSGNRTTFLWNYESRMTNAYLSNGDRYTHSYSPDALRVQSAGPTGPTKFIWDDRRLIVETDGANASQVVYTQLPSGYGNVISQNRKTGVLWSPSYFHFTSLGTTDRLTSAAQLVTDVYVSDAFGRQISATGTTINRFRFIGQFGYEFESALDLYYVRARWLVARLGRWLSTDPFRASTLGNYTYVESRPIQHIDPSGLFAAKPRCCLLQFGAPVCRSGCIARAGVEPGKTPFLTWTIGEEFTVNAKFKEDDCGCLCKCCEYRQWVRGRLMRDGKTAGGDPKIDETEYIEDYLVHKGVVKHVGHRDRPIWLDKYYCPTQSELDSRLYGCNYSLFDFPNVGVFPGLPGNQSASVELDFRGEIIDVCNGNQVIATANWSVDCFWPIGPNREIPRVVSPDQEIC